ncbi:MAG: indolepyruvate ferredoxin oxidoreductase subunit alpha [Clostridiales Family XIII bacterium]|jgi:indolepyruvate ferredoxin oxidoreductase alpha subunit|nr:indolepyruvate ferredoxin oxidoreductase subunit alpha [Clostridiales Family XIII bacterium]
MSERRLMTGNEAAARGAWEAGLAFASAYPGTPSTEILENLAEYKSDLYAEWAPNEKTAMEAAIGASMAGVRSLAALKHGGVNVAADPLFTFAYTGVNGGMVLVSADDPGLHSSQNEQDNRHYAEAAKVLMLEPSDSAETLEYMKLGFELSERFDTPVMLRMTTRICHSKSIVTLGERTPAPHKIYERNIRKFVATPANARAMRAKLTERLEQELSYANAEAVRVGVNRIERASEPGEGERIGVVSAGAAYQYARDVFGGRASYLKLGLTWPMPIDLIREFAEEVDKLYIVEELDAFMETRIKAAGIDCVGKERIPVWDELNTDIVRFAVFGERAETLNSDMKAVPRPPTLCAGCPHRGLFWGLSKRKNVLVSGDIGCYTLGSAPPLSSMDSCFCMGGSIGAGHGAAKAFKESGQDARVAAVIGDSTFFHSGVTGLMNAVFNGSNIVTVILDNRITAMTGQQQNPGSGFTLTGEAAPEVDIPELCKAVGIREDRIRVIDPLDLNAVNKALDEALADDAASVIVTRRPCVLKRFSERDLLEFGEPRGVCVVDEEKCTRCKLCVKTGCPAIYGGGDTVFINENMCTGCGVCEQVCPFDAISLKE